MCSRPAAAPPTRPAQWPARRHASTEHSPVPSAPPEPHLGHACPRLGVVRLRNAAPVPSAPSTSRLGCADRSERHETPDPVRSNAVDSRFHGVRQQADAVWLQYRWCCWGEGGSCVSACRSTSPARQAASSSNGGTRAGPGQSAGRHHAQAYFAQADFATYWFPRGWWGRCALWDRRAGLAVP